MVHARLASHSSPKVVYLWATCRCNKYRYRGTQMEQPNTGTLGGSRLVVRYSIPVPSVRGTCHLFLAAVPPCCHPPTGQRCKTPWSDVSAAPPLVVAVQSRCPLCVLMQPGSCSSTQSPPKPEQQTAHGPRLLTIQNHRPSQQLSVSSPTSNSNVTMKFEYAL